MQTSDRGESNSMQGASVKQTRSVCSERARTPAGGRSQCGFAKRTRGFSAQTVNKIWMRCRSGAHPRSQPVNASPRPRRIELCAGRGRKENAAATQNGTHFPNGDLGGKPVPEYRLRLGRSFRMTPQAEIASRNRATERDTLSQWRLKWKLRPGIDTQNGMHFPDGLLAETASQNPRSKRDTPSALPPQLQNPCALHHKTG